MKKIISLLMVFAFIFAFAACDDKAEETTTAATTAAATNADSGNEEVITEPLVETIEPKGTVIGSYDPGEIAFYLNVVNKEGKTNVFTVYTDKATLIDAMLSKSMITVKETSKGTVLASVDSEEHDYETSGYAWVIYVDGKKYESDINKIALQNGATYEFKVETF